MKEENAMKKNYVAPEADLLCFRPVEDLAIVFDSLWNKTETSGEKGAAVGSTGDIKITIK